MRYLAIFVLIFGLLASNTEAVSGDFRDWEENKKNEMIVNMLKDFSSDSFLKKYRYNVNELESILKNLSFDLSLLERRGGRMSREDRIAKYTKIFLHEGGFQKGVEYLIAHKKTLDDAEKKYGVSKETIVAILWIESNFSRNIGRSSALKGLYNLYVRNIILYEKKKPRRVREYRLQFAYFLALCRQRGLDINEVKGSYAGALGIPQFMPYSYERDGVDGDGDGDINLFANHTDSIFSVANYLNKRGWSKNQRKAVLRYNYDSAYVYTVFEYAKIISKIGETK